MAYFNDSFFQQRFRPNYTHIPFPTYNPYGYTMMPGTGVSGPGYALPGMAGAQAFSGRRQRYESQFGTPNTTATATLLAPQSYLPVSGGSEDPFAVGAGTQAAALRGGPRRPRR